MKNRKFIRGFIFESWSELGTFTLVLLLVGLLFLLGLPKARTVEAVTPADLSSPQSQDQSIVIPFDDPIEAIEQSAKLGKQMGLKLQWTDPIGNLIQRLVYKPSITEWQRHKPAPTKVVEKKKTNKKFKDRAGIIPPGFAFVQPQKLIQ